MSKVFSSNQRESGAAADSGGWQTAARSGTQPGPAANREHQEVFRSPKRISITLPHHAFAYLLKRSDQEGRSLSNLAAFLLESAIPNDHNLRRP